MPSPTWRTVPTSARSVSTSYCSIRERRIDVISSGRSFISAPHQFLSQSFKSSTHARVRAIRPGPEDEASDQIRVDAARRLDLPPGRLLDLAEDLPRLRVGQLARRHQLDGQAPLLARHEPVELLGHLLELARTALLRNHLEEVAEEHVLVAGEVGEDAGLGAGLELRVAQDRAQLRRLGDRLREIGQRLVHLREAARVLRGAEEGFGVDAACDRYLASTSREKSSEPIASLISSRSRSASSFLPTTIDAASPRASCISLRCSSRRFRASSRAWSASSIDRRICSRRSSIVFWIGPNAYFLSTNSVIKNAMIVQIIRPGVTWMRALDASIN